MTTLRRGVLAGLLLVAIPLPALAHGVGGRGDLPLPLEFFLVGAGIVLLASFGALAVLWPEPRLQGGPVEDARGRRIPAWARWALRLAGVGALATVVIAGLVGDPSLRTNSAPLLVWIVFWLVVPFGSAVIGNVWAEASPWATLGRWMRLDGRDGAPGRLGVWPASVAFVAFTWMELVYPDSGDAGALALAAVVYTLYMLVWMERVGVDRAVAAADGFAVYQRLLSGIAPFGRDAEGRLVRRGWLRALTALPQWPGLVFMVVAMIGTVTYDGLSGTPWWDSFSATVSGSSQSIWLGTLALPLTVALIAAAYLAASWWAARIARSPDLGPLDVARSFAHTLVPIALAYAVAHYFTLIVFEGQMLLSSLSDPFGLGWNLFGTADWVVNFTVLSPTAVWWLQSIAILAGHLAGVVLAHDRALAIFPPARAVRTQYAMLALMVLLTGLGLTILAAG